MVERNQQRIGHRTPKHSLRVVIGKAIDLFISAIAILLATKFLEPRHQVGSKSPEIIKTAPAADERNQQGSGHQTSDINVSMVTWAAIGLMISVIAVCLTVGGLFSLFKHQYQSASAPSGIITAGRLPPEPRLETNPTAELQKLLEAENAKLNSYGWIDKSAGVIRIPIDRAMDLLAQRGLPARDGDHELVGKTLLQMRQEKAEGAKP